MAAPTLLDIKRFNVTLHGSPLSDGWRIPSSKGDDVIWNIVLAYLNSFPSTNRRELTKRIKCLTGRSTVNENVKNSLKMCNPFLHRNACFCDDAISELVTVFKQRVLEDYAKNDSAPFRSVDENSKYLEVSSKLLSCNIIVISLFPPRAIFNTFPSPYFQIPPIVYPNDIALLHEMVFPRENGKMQLRFSYCIPGEVGIRKQRQALAEILQRATIPDNRKTKTIQKICRLPDVGDNFIISLLKNDFVQIIPSVYNSPYVLSKLTDAGFETDPRTNDSSGKSAFFHALKTEESELVSVLYDHAANACLQTDASIRSPDPVIVENLLCLKDYLKLLEKDLESEEISEKSRSLFRDLCRFNEFQIEICRSINNIRLRLNYYDQTDKEYEANQRKETILTILKIYETYFHYRNGEAEPCIDADDISRFREFYKHRDYFDKLDFSSAVMFFDNLFLLKERLKLPSNEYLNVESEFFLFIFCRKYLERYEKEKYFHFVSRWITFQERLSLERHMSCFKKILAKTELTKDNIVDKLPDAVVRTLTNLPQIYGQFLIFRLQHYLNAATGLVVKDLKSILVIERCLQVMGECCKESDFNSVQRIICLALPKDFIKHLKQIRNRLAHIKPYELLYRNNLEQDLELFVGIQNELSKLKKLLIPIYSAHKYELDQFLLLHSVKSVCSARRRSILEVHENQLKAILPAPETEGSQLSVPTYSCQQPWKRYFDDMHSSLRKEIDDLNRSGYILNKNSINHYKQILQNMISAIAEVLKNLKVAVPEEVSELESHFWCLESFLTFITKDWKLTKYRRPLMLMIKERKYLCIGLKENACEFQNVKNSTYTTMDNTPMAKAGALEEQQSSEPEEANNPMDNFVQFDVLFNTESENSIIANQSDANECSDKTAENSETNQVKNEISEENFENCCLQNMFPDNVSQETIDTEECKEVINLHENAEDNQTKIQNEENDLPFPELIGVPTSDWFLSNVFNVDHDYPVNSQAECVAEVTVVKRNKKNSKFNAFVEHATTILDGYEAIAYDIFQEIPNKKEKNAEFHSGSIEKYCLILKGWTILKNAEKEFILQSVPKQFQNVHEQKRRVKGLLRGKTKFTKEIEDELSKLNLKNKDIKEIKENIEFGLIDDAIGIVDSARDYFSDLKVMMEEREIDKKECELLCTKLQIPDNAKDILMKLVPGLNKKVPGNQFQFLRNRIKMLKNILIVENNAIQQLWERATTPRRKMHVKEKVIQLYLNNSEIQAAVETLLFDCMTILSSKELKSLWRKTTNLFNGINLRNVLAHGHPLLESLGRLLDPYDFPSELVEKMLKLISDEHVMNCIEQILEQSGTDFSGFLKIMNDEDNEQYKNLREQILECDQ